MSVVRRGEVFNHRRFDARQFERLDFYGEIMGPIGARTVLTAKAGIVGRGMTIIQVARTGRARSFVDT
jgi:hypothetical protein